MKYKSRSQNGWFIFVFGALAVIFAIALFISLNATTFDRLFGGMFR
ncbi:hypothetical protein [Alicyclobacillus ferrooxydans]|nr:hypothetical protein [Alicyclobacillus ferrooxydans]